jgi:hypothetical protein
LKVLKRYLNLSLVRITDKIARSKKKNTGLLFTCHLIIRKAASLNFTIYKVSGYTHKVIVGGMFLALMFDAT